ncbi:N-acetylmuramoyl-L-alanine amidase [Wenyingzhuangia sp. 2_MG-2023]|uniref:N-acetylmuramoyl-L-alanine amidase family protein n=1 Tax=Wenyingzhuangia sp. 2_MG-2023 TaxID=3062639 RepID=UPI0026E26EAF|nr:N-acetylmuramoyl-L-alanine amidase [Wenyingzhuangia sp. 2_MG-2023]MDO6738017.1 N-acetylmuramoyl-L-alanine amidase [Wenyingzhuangia sp. 2_MG-2023]MDO6802629.1 N-acetylmuramoyl-L-alanine amidase [Wenyingzhuangia sp. 1_MG-2023]
MKLIHISKYHKFSLNLIAMLCLLLLSSVFTEVIAQKKPFLVILDAGHGGKDPGKIGYKGAKEKDVALNIVLKTGKLLESVPGVKVAYTRKTDVFVDLWKRGDIANEADADLFVSVHCNAHTSQAIGSETWVLGLNANERNFNVAKAENEVILQEENHEDRYQGFDPKSPTSVIGLSLEQEEYLDQSLLLASLIQEEFEKKLNRVNRGVKQAGFVVLYQTYMPSVLIETGFLTNRIEGQYLYSKLGQEQMSKSISNSILDYYKRQQLNIAGADFREPMVAPIQETSVKSADKPVEKVMEEPVLSSGMYYKVQLASGKNRISTSSYNFKGFKNVERVKVDGGYKYYLSEYKTRNQAELAMQLAKNKGYKSAFLVLFDSEGNIVPKTSVLKPSDVSAKKSDVYYKVQIASSTKKISTVSSNFKGLSDVEAVKVGNYYKYYLGKTSSYEKAKEYLQKAKDKKYKSAFLVAFLNNERITLKEALRGKTN